jgi:hypothetical protein
MSNIQGKPTISPGIVLFLWTFLAFISGGIALQSITSTSNETLTSLFSWDRLPRFIESRFTPVLDPEQQIAFVDGPSASTELITRVTELDEQLETVAKTVNTLKLDNSRIQEDGVRTSDRVAQLESSLDFVTGSLPTETGFSRNTGEQTSSNANSGDVSVRYAPFPLDRESGGGNELSPGSVQQTEFAVIVARSADQASLTRIWTMLQEEQGSRFDDLTPRIIIESDPQAGTQLALLAGPLKNAQQAIELCARLALPSSTCQPIPYGGDVLPTLTSNLQTE